MRLLEIIQKQICVTFKIYHHDPGACVKIHMNYSAHKKTLITNTV